MEISIIEVREDGKAIFKVTRRIPSMSVSETKVFESKEEARRQFDEWLNE